MNWENLIALAIVAASVLWRQSAHQKRTETLVESMRSDIGRLIDLERSTFERWANHEARLRVLERWDGDDA
jgi:hypothetical protein